MCNESGNTCGNRFTGVMGWWNRAKYVDSVLDTGATAHPVGLVVAIVKRKIGFMLGNDVSQRIDSPLVLLQRDRQAQCDASGRPKPGSRLAAMSADEIRYENDCAAGLSRIAFDGDSDSRSVDVVARSSDINRFSDFKNWTDIFHNQPYGSVDTEKVGVVFTKTEKNEDSRCATVESHKALEYFSQRIFAGGLLSRSDLAQYDDDGKVIDFNHGLDATLIEIFVNNMDDFKSDSRHFQVKPDGLYDRSGRRPYITMSRMVSSGICDAGHDSVYNMDTRRVKDFASYDVHDAFYAFLVHFPIWDRLANGKINQGIRDASQ